MGSDVDMPLTYTSWVFRPSGSRKNWCWVLSGNLTTLSSIDGQYRGPTPEICPEYIAERCTFSRISCSVSGVVNAMWQLTWGCTIFLVRKLNGVGSASP